MTFFILKNKFVRCQQLMRYNDYIYHAHARSVCSHEVLFTVCISYALRQHIFSQLFL